MPSDPDILEKVRKLLRLSRSANEHEAALALERAFRLAERHQVDVAALELDPEIELIIHERFPVGLRLSYESKLLLPLVRDFFHVAVVLSKPDAIFAGTPTDIAIAHYVFGFLTAQCRRALRDFETGCRRVAKRRPSLTRRKNFIYGWISGLHRTLSAARTQEHGGGAQAALADSTTAVALRRAEQQRADYMARLCPNTTSNTLAHPRRQFSALEAGYREGRDTQIRTPLNAGQAVLRLT